MSDLPFRVEYAKSARSSCKLCRNKIDLGALRIAVMVKSPLFDGKMPHWYHDNCFFKKQRIKDVADVYNFEAIRWEDQEKIKKSIDESLAGPALTKGNKAKKRKSEVSLVKDFSVQYAKSSKSECRGCGEKIIKNDVRLSKKDYESEDARRYGGIDRWHHLDCFVRLRNDLEFYESAKSLPGLESLSAEHQEEVCKKLPKITPSPKPNGDEVDGVSSAKKSKIDVDKLKEQNSILFGYRDQLAALKLNELTQLLRCNNQAAPVGKEFTLDAMADVMTFGVLLPCEVCSGQYEFRSGVGYFCTGNRNEWLKCENISVDPKRDKLKIPKYFQEKYPFLEKYEYKPRKRIFQVVATADPSTSASTEPKSKLTVRLPLKNMTIVILGIPNQKKEELKFEIAKLGGKVSGTVYQDTTGIISTKEMVNKAGKHMEKAKTFGIQVVPENFVDECKKGGNAADHLVSMNIASWGSNPLARLKIEEEKERKPRRGEIKLEKKKVTVKGGAIVYAESGLEDCAHVYKKGNDLYNTALCLSDLQSGRNSYYKMQILESDTNFAYWLFRSWGRIGTTQGDHKVQSLSLDDAVKLFEELFEEKTGNLWKNRKHFVKVPGRMALMDVCYEDGGLEERREEMPSKLAPELQDLMSLIFNANTMKHVMLEYELDYEKMPLGKLSKRQIEEAYSVLTRLQQHIDEGGDPHLCVGFSNQFYTLVPHNYGNRNPPIINNLELVEEKRKILDNLLEMEIAYSILNAPAVSEGDVHLLDRCYAKLNADMEVLEKDTDEFKVLRRYLKNTHAETHSSYKLQISEVFRVKRHEEHKRYKPFKKLHNRKLLWHGSRLTNFAGILSQGLRIAPKEAPSTGYMFGKGIYFADMVSKSANYCAARKNEEALLLLCEVALGDMYERTNAEYIQKLPTGKHSCKGIGQTAPNPLQSHHREDGVEIPLGNGIPTNVKKSSLLYNEYIVYDVAQVHMQYLLKVKFV